MRCVQSYGAAGGSALRCLFVLALLFGGVAIFMACTWYLSKWSSMSPPEQKRTKVRVGVGGEG